ncbi:MAG: phosphoribosylformylglycinamidine synthase subunit PurL [bacterium]|nr:phosphoribosylformylglycinamidine synthase subunit PurL [bacterium]
MIKDQLAHPTAPSTTITRVDVWHKTLHIQNLPDSGKKIAPSRLFFLQGNLSESQLHTICTELLADPVTETFSINAPYHIPNMTHSLDITYQAGVTDPAAESLLNAVRLLRIDGLDRVATGARIVFVDVLGEAELTRLAKTHFSNPLIQRYAIDAPITAPFVPYQAVDDTVEIVSLKDVDDAELMKISSERRLSLDINEMQAIRAYFLGINRNPTDAELEMLAQTWSEHCVHKTFKALVTYTGPAPDAPADSPSVTQTVDGLLKTYLRSATNELNKDWVYSAFVDNAGIIKFDDTYDVAFKVETHNRPSALEPFGGANTGSGGVIRDVLGVSARPIANTDILFFGTPDLPMSKLPDNVLHPRKVAQGVVAGIEDYGNKMGIPTVNGAIFYHDKYTANPLVFCGCLGILPHNSHRNVAQAGDYIVVIGGRTGRDGLRGATFSSMEMDNTTATLSGGAVQIGHPIHEKQVQEVVLRARDAGLYTAITDCGAGGLSSAVGEMGAELGATVQLADVPLKYPGLRPWEIWLSEAQERMVLAISPNHWDEFVAICDIQLVEASIIGTFTPTGRLTLYYGDKLVGDMTMDFLHNGIPRRQLEAIWQYAPVTNTAGDAVAEAPTDTLLKLLNMPSVRSKEDVIRKYDHEVGSGTAVKPLVGVDNHAPSDAAVIAPLDTVRMGSKKAVALSNGLAPLYGEIDPYAMAWASIDEAMRNIVAVGADPDQVAILDNFSWGNTQLPDRLGSLVRCLQGCYSASLAYGTPFISGKDSLNNEYVGEDGQRHAIPGTLVISAVGIVPDVEKTCTMDLKQADNSLFLIGQTWREFGGSHYALLHGQAGGTAPQPAKNPLETLRKLHVAIQNGWIASCHDVSEGGLSVALAEMCIGGRLGADIALAESWMLFSESLTRFIIEVKPEHRSDVEIHFADSHLNYLGVVTQKPELRISISDSVHSVSVVALEGAWRGIPEKLPTQQPPIGKKSAHTFSRTPSTKISKPKVLILHANGSNRDRDALLACEVAGGDPSIVHINQVIMGQEKLLDYHMLIIPGGFSYGDDLGAGVLWALDLRERFGDVLKQFVTEGRPVLGICNGFQTLVKSGILPNPAPTREVTLTYNEQGRFECRWVYLKVNPSSQCLFTQGIDDLMYVPIAHGEGRVMVSDEAVLTRLWDEGLATLTYVDGEGNPAPYPYNPNGAMNNIAGICNAQGNVFGLMPHPENHIFAWQHPRFGRGEIGMNGLRIFQNGIKYS